MVKFWKCFVLIVLVARCVNAGILTGDLKLKSKPFTINSHHAPVHIHINTDKLKATLPPLSLPKPAKPPPRLSDLFKPSLFSKRPSVTPNKLPFPKLTSSKSLLPSNFKLPSLSESIFPQKSLFPSKSLLSSRKLSRSSILSSSGLPSLSSSKLSLPPISKSLLPSPLLSPVTKLSVPIIPPIIPKVPLIPLPLIPPFIPPLPLLPIIPPIIPGLPLILPIKNPLKPIKVPILGRSPLQTALGSELSPVVVDIKKETKTVIIEKKLRNLLKRGSLTTAEFNRFKRLLVG